MQYQIAFDPQLNLSAAEFVAAWNTSEHVSVGTASLSVNPPGAFISPEMAVALVAVAAAIPATVITSFVSEILKKKFIDKEPPKITVTTISTPDGKPLLVIKQEER